MISFSASDHPGISENLHHVIWIMYRDNKNGWLYLRKYAHNDTFSQLPANWII